jgi:hypothetical protein
VLDAPTMALINLILNAQNATTTTVPGTSTTVTTPVTQTTSVTTPVTTTVVSTPVPSFTRTISQGSTGTEVEALQTFLNTHGFPIAASGPGSLGQETTSFGALTKVALEEFQKYEGLTTAIPGALDAQTMARINAIEAAHAASAATTVTTPVTTAPVTTQTTPVTSTVTTTSVAPTTSFTRALSQGSTGTQVQALQIFLNDHGFQITASGAGSPGKESTTFGAATKAALAQFQQSEGLTNAKPGVLDAPTIAAINSILNSTSSGVTHTQAVTTSATTNTVTTAATTPVSTTAVASTVTTPVTTTTQVTPKSFTRVLTQGSTGADVKALQVFLNDHGFQIAATGDGSPGKESTTFGAATKAALAQFQQSEGLTNAKSGVLDAPTIALINTILKGQ